MLATNRNEEIISYHGWAGIEGIWLQLTREENEKAST